MANISLRILFAHWLTFLEALQQIFWNYLPQPLLSTVFPELIEENSKFSPIVYVPRLHDPPDYSTSVDLATICPVQTLLQTPLAMNLSCSVGRSDYDVDIVSSVESTHYYVFLDIPVWRPAVSYKDKLPASPSAQVGDDHAQTNMATHGARGLSFCPVLVGIRYIQSLLHLYMLLMIPSLLNHWFEDVLVYESLNPTELLDCSWLLHTSLWMAPWYILRYGVRKGVPCLHWRFRRASYRSAHPPIPRIVLIKVDGEAVPVNFVEDHQASADVGVWSSLESAKLEMRHSQSAISDSEPPRTSTQSLISDGENCCAAESEVLPTRTVSHQGEHEGGEAQEGIRLGSPIPEFAEESRPFVNQIPDEQLEISLVLVEAADEPLYSVKKGTLILPLPGLDTLATPSNRNIDERTDEFERIAFLEAGVDDVHQDGIDSLGEQESSVNDVAFSPWSLVDDYDPGESETPSKTVSATSSTVGLQDMSTPVKSVRFVIDDDASAADHLQASLSAPRTDKSTCAWNLGSQVGDDGVTSVHIPVVPFDPSMDKQDATSPGQVIKPVFPVVLSEERVEGNDATVLAESLSPSLTGMPIVNLPSVVATREDMRCVEMDPMVPATLIEDIATRSPLQILSPITPAVVINMNYLIGAEDEQGLTSSGTKKLDQGSPHAGHAFDRVGTLNDEAAACEMSDTLSPREDKSCLPSPSIDGLNSVCSAIVDSNPPLWDARTLGITLSTLATVSEIGMPVASGSPVVTNANPSAAKQSPRTNELEAENLYETPQYCSDEKDHLESLPGELQGPGISVPSATNRIRLPAVSESPEESSAEGQVNFVATEKSDGMITTLTGQPVSLSAALAAELPTMKSSEQLLALSGTRKDTTSLSIISAEKKAGELDNGKTRKADNIPWDHPSMVSKPASERSLSGSMHAPSESLRIQKTNGYVDLDQTPVPYEASQFMAHSVASVRPNEGKGGTNVITENTSNCKQDLSASIHAPRRTSKLEVKSSTFQSRDESRRDHRRSITNPALVPERETLTKSGPPNWTAMPGVVDAFRMFKHAPSENTIRRVSSIAECTKRGPMLGAVGQKGIATSSLNNISATANIQSHWIHGSGLLLVRDLVSSDPADFNLRACTNMRTSKVHGMNAVPVQQVLHPGVLDIPPYALQHGITPCTVRVNAGFSSMVAGPAEIRRQQSTLLPHGAEIGPILGSQRWMAYRG